MKGEGTWACSRMAPWRFWETGPQITGPARRPVTSVQKKKAPCSPAWLGGPLVTNHSSGPPLLTSSCMEEMKVEILAGQREGWPASFGRSNPTSSLWRQFELDKSLVLPGMTPGLSCLESAPESIAPSRRQPHLARASLGSRSGEPCSRRLPASFLESGRDAKRLRKLGQDPPKEGGRDTSLRRGDQPAAGTSGAACGSLGSRAGCGQPGFLCVEGNHEKAPSGEEQAPCPLPDHPFPTGFLRQEALNCWDGPP